jgi:rSAM/selenodomain-associated transferase 1
MLPAIAVFAKAPVPGRVKTRLAVAIGADEAARRYREIVSLLLQRLIEAAKRLGSDIELHTDTPTDAWTAYPVTARLQVSGDLGERMLHALQSGLDAGRPRMLILGGDVPTVPIAHLETLLTAETDVALGPAEDGGYYAIACRRTHSQMFAGVEWSTPAACQQTAAACRHAGLSVSFGPVWFDIDEPSDLDRI